MSVENQRNCAVWFDIPVADLDRAVNFYQTVLAINVKKESYGDCEFAVLEHEQGNGGCLVVKPDAVASDKGILLYLNVDGRIDDAVNKAETFGSKIVETIHPIGEYGCRAIILDSEGNRIVLHSTEKKT